MNPTVGNSTRREPAKQRRRQAGQESVGEPTARASAKEASRRAGHADQAAVVQGDAWERFWLQPSRYNSLAISRVLLATTALLVFLNQWSDIAIWFGEGGLLATDRLGRLVAATGAESLARWQISPLYWLDSVWTLRLFLAVGVLASVASMLGRGGRWALATCWLATIWLANRQWILLGLTEYPLALGLLGITIAGAGTNQLDWRHTLGRRLLQVQALAVVTVVALAQWQWGGWLSGEAFPRLVAGGANRIVDLQWLAFSTPSNRLFGLAIIVVPLAATLLWITCGFAKRLQAFRNAAAWILVGQALVVAALADRWLFGLAMAGMLVTLWQPAGDRSPADSAV